MFDFGLLDTTGFFTAEEEIALAVVGAAAAVAEPFAAWVDTRGDFGLEAAPFRPAFRKGEPVRAMPGVPVLDGGLLGVLIAGLSHDEKKSSPASPAGVFVPVPSLSSPTSSTVT